MKTSDLNDAQLRYIDSLIESSRRKGSVEEDQIRKTVSVGSDNYDEVVRMFEDEGIKVIPSDNSSDYYDDDNDGDRFSYICTTLDREVNRKKNFSALDHYLDDVSKQGFLSQEEEAEYASLVKEGLNASKKLNNKDLSVAEIASLNKVVRIGEEAKDILFNANASLAINIAKKYRNKGVDFEDLIQEANRGLSLAIDKFDVSRGNRLTTVAYPWIQLYTRRAIANLGRSVRIPVGVMDAINRMYKIENDLVTKLGRVPTEEEIAKAMGITTSKVNEYRGCCGRVQSLDEVISDDDDGTFGDLQVDENTPSPGEDYMRNRKYAAIEKAKKVLTDKERDIINRRMGFTVDGHTESLEELGRAYGTSRETIRRIENAALEKMRVEANRYM